MAGYVDGYGYESYGQPGWMRALHWLNASLRLGRPFGVELRIYWLAIVLVPLIALSELAPICPTWLESITLSLLLSVWLYVVIYAHEMGHVVAGWRWGVRTPLITLSPLGGLAHMSSAAPSPRAEVLITLAGPVTHLPWLLVAWPLSRIIPYGVAKPDGWLIDPLWLTLQQLVDLNAWLLLFNLLPLFPMDGGRILRGALATRMHPNRATLIAARVGMAGAVLMGIGAIFVRGYQGGILLAIAINNFLHCRREVLLAQLVESPYAGGERAETWQLDPDGWKSGGFREEPGDDRPSEPGVLARWLAKRRAKAEAEAPLKAAQLEADLDRVLARITEVGMAGLTDEERAVLRAASEARRRAGR